MAWILDQFEPVVNPLVIVDAANGGLGAIPSAAATTDGTTARLALQVLYTDAGVLFCPMTTTQRLALSATGAIVDGTEVYDITLHAKFIWNANTSAWDQLGGAADQISLANGAAATPSLFFTNSTDTGIYRVADDILGVSAGGNLQLQISSTANAVNYVDITGGSTGLAPIIRVDGTDTNIDFYVGLKGTGTFNLSTNGGSFKFPIALPAANTVVPLSVNSTGVITAVDTAVGPVVYRQTTSIPAATFIQLFATPITLVAAPGVGKMIVPHMVLVKTVGQTAAYGAGTGPSTQLLVKFAGGTVAISTPIPIAAITAAPSGGGRVFSFIPGGFENAVDVSDNKALVLTCDVSNLANGDGNVLIDTWYSIVNTQS